MQVTKENTLRVTLHREWFLEIAAGIKTKEYREINPYWEKRLAKKYEFIKFVNGYREYSPTLVVEYKGVKKVTKLFPLKNVVDTVFEIDLGNVISIFAPDFIYRKIDSLKEEHARKPIR